MKTEKNRWYSFFSLSLVHIVFLFLFALLLRLYAFRIGEVFFSSDEVFLFQYSVKPLFVLYHPSSFTFFTELFRFFNFAWGWGTLVWSTLSAAVTIILRIPITEFTINIPYVFIGAGSVVLAYFVGKEIHGKLFGFIAAFLIALLPSHVGFSRSVGINAIVGLFFFFLSIFLFLKYFKTKKELYRVIGYCAIGFLIITENQSVGVLFVLGYISWLYCKEKNIFFRIYSCIKQLISIKGFFFAILIISPTLVSAMYLLSKGMIKQSYLNILHSKPMALNLYFFETLQTIYDNTGAALFFLLIIGVLYYCILLACGKQRKASTLFFFFFVFYSAPWFFLIIPEFIVLRGYNTYTIVSLIFLTSYFIEDSILYISRLKKTFFKLSSACLFGTMLGFIGLYTFFSLSSAVYMHDHVTIHLPQAIFGSAQGNNGIKTIGYYIRENLPDNAVVFADTELFVTQYYCARTSVGDLDLTPEETLDLFKKKIVTTPIEYVFLDKKNEMLFAKELSIEGFNPIAYATHNGDIKGILYAKDIFTSVIILDIDTYDALFDKKYGNIPSLFVDYG